jgi:Family of unknown function (DUF6338)
MSFDAFTVRLALLALPGILAAGVQSANRHSSANKDFSFILRTFVWSVLSYSLAFLLYWKCGWKFHVSSDSASIQAIASAVDEIALASVIGVICGSISVVVSSKRWVPRFLNFIGVSKFSGCDDIWEYVLDDSTAVSRYVQIRDYDNCLIYSGLVKSFSDSPQVREILLINAQVYGLTSAALLYTIPAIYLSMPIDKCNLEFQEQIDV